MKKKVIILFILVTSILFAQCVHAETDGDNIDIDKKKTELDDKVKKAEEEYKKQVELCKKRVVSMYVKSNSSTKVEMFLRSENLFDYYKKTYIMTIIYKKDKEVGKNLSMAKNELEKSKKLQKELADDLKNTDTDKEKDIDSVTQPGKDAKDEISKRKLALKYKQAELDEMEKAYKDIDNYIKNINSEVPEVSGGMVWPTPGCSIITSGFEWRWGSFHDGIDIGAAYGSTVVAAKGGKVIMSGWNGGFGYTIMIDYGGGIITLYGHNSSLVVSNGEMVKTGQPVAKIGSTGFSTGAHLHFTVKKNGTAVSPLNYVRP